MSHIIKSLFSCTIFTLSILLHIIKTYYPVCLLSMALVNVILLVKLFTARQSEKRFLRVKSFQIKALTKVLSYLWVLRKPGERKRQFV